MSWVIKHDVGEGRDPLYWDGVEATSLTPDVSMTKITGRRSYIWNGKGGYTPDIDEAKTFDTYDDAAKAWWGSTYRPDDTCCRPVEITEGSDRR